MEVSYWIPFLQGRVVDPSISGDVQLRNLELRKEVRYYSPPSLSAQTNFTPYNKALDQMKLPLNVVEGHLGKLTLT